MLRFEINENEAGQRFDKYLHKLMPKAPSSFFYKMLRKKNIVLNGKKAEGKEKLCLGDEIKLFLATETFQGFLEENTSSDSFRKAYHMLRNIRVLFENEHLLIADKPSGMLSQKAKPEDLSLNEWLIGYLLSKNETDEKKLTTYKPSICNRLDRNTAGLVICAKSLPGSQEINRLIADRRVGKFYRTFVKGQVTKEYAAEGLLIKDEQSNKVTVISGKDRAGKQSAGTTPFQKESYIQTRYYPLQHFSDMTLLEVELITGKTHQIRAHLAKQGHPLIGDYKYGDKKINDEYKRRYGISSQLLLAYRLEFPVMKGCLSDLSRLVVTAREPDIFQVLCQKG